jgi:hypothetical protein
LRVLRLGLEALIRAGVTDIESPELLDPEALPVAGQDGTTECVVHGWEVGVTGSFESVLKVLELAQKSEAFLQVRLKNLHPAGATGGEGAVVRGGLEFYGFALVEAPPAKG